MQSILTADFSQYDFSTVKMFEGKQNRSTPLINNHQGHEGRSWISLGLFLKLRAKSVKIENRFLITSCWKCECIVTHFSVCTMMSLIQTVVPCLQNWSNPHGKFPVFSDIQIMWEVLGLRSYTQLNISEALDKFSDSRSIFSLFCLYNCRRSKHSHADFCLLISTVNGDAQVHLRKAFIFALTEVLSASLVLTNFLPIAVYQSIR